MAVKPFSTLMAIKVLSFAPGLTANARAVGAVLLDRYNRETSQCDPGLASIADHLGICSRTVIRSIRQLVSAGLIVKVRHGGYSHRNSYQPIWERFRQLEAEWSSRLHRRRSFTEQKLSPSDGRPCHVGSDKPVTQTSKENLHKKTCSSGRPNEESVDDARRLKFISGRIRPGGAAHAAADVVGVTGIIGNGACSAIVIPIATGGIATGVGGNTVTERGPLGGGLYAEIGDQSLRGGHE